jgi:hypothetical protein
MRYQEACIEKLPFFFFFGACEKFFGITSSELVQQLFIWMYGVIYRCTTGET